MTLQQKALEIAISQLGVQEQPKGSNRGPEVDLYIKSVGLDPASASYAWCAAFVYWCYEKAAESMGRINPLAKTGGVLEQWRLRKEKHRVIVPQPGDIGVLDFGKGVGHIFIVEHVQLDHTDNVEGNTNDEGSREGYEVCRRSRARGGKTLGYLRFE
jgi:hypothetical protein